MMRQLFRIFFAPICLTAGLAAMTHAAVTPGATAPDFTLTAVDGKPVSLSQFRGKYVVLEWFNSECPFVQKHYTSGNMQKLQSRYTSEGIVWLAINSTNPEHSNYRDPQRSREIMSQWKGSPTALLLDPEGGVGQAYEARTTPHMYIIDPQGKLVYRGGIDDKPSFSPRDIPDSRNYVATALDELLAGKPVNENDTRPYGCSVKYKY
jgi:peroxiredoxin